MAELRLEVRKFTDLSKWRWVLTDHAGVFIADHDVALDRACWQYEAFAGLLGYLSWPIAPESRDATATFAGDVDLAAAGQIIDIAG